MLPMHLIPICNDQWEPVTDQQLAVKAASHPSLQLGELELWKGEQSQPFPGTQSGAEGLCSSCSSSFAVFPLCFQRGRQTSCALPYPTVLSQASPHTFGSKGRQLSCGTPLLAVGGELPFLSLTYLLGLGLFATSVRDPGVYSINGV